jgi:O-succinylbenzoic acid--CoA ligase
MNPPKFHQDFKLNGHGFTSVEALLNHTQINFKEVYLFLTQWFDEDDFLTVNTSGSTGKPKIIKLKKEHMINSALATAAYFDLRPQARALLCLSPNYIAGKMMLVRALTIGWHLDIVDPAGNPLENMKKEYDFSAMVPLQLFNALATIEKIKILIVGGGVVSFPLQCKIQNVSTKIYATYGMTETTSHIAVKKLNHFKEEIKAGQSDFTSIYTVLPNTKISQDTRGCLVIDAPKVSDKKLITNDLVELISENEFIWLGRFDTVINSGGVKLIPEQIEEKLSKIISQRFFISSKPDEVLGEKVILIIEDSSVKISKEIIKPFLDKFETPKEIYYLDSFLETETKKVDRNKTKALLDIK